MDNKVAPPPYNPYDQQQQPSAAPYGFHPQQQQQPNPYQQLPQPHLQQPTAAPAGPTIITVTSPTVIGGCPVCHSHSFENNFTCCGIFCCILFFPLGLLCLFTMTKKVCANCGYSP